MSQGPKRPRAEALTVAREVLEKLSPYCELRPMAPGEGASPRIEIAGSLRRGRPMIGDIEIVAMPKHQADLFGGPTGDDAISRFLHERQVPLSKDGPRYKQFDYRGYKVDLYLVEDLARWGWRLMLSTGSAEFNRWLVTEQPRGARPPHITQANGLLYRLLGNFETEEILADDEMAVFEAYGLPWIPPAHREPGLWERYAKEANHG